MRKGDQFEHFKFPDRDAAAGSYDVRNLKAEKQPIERAEPSRGAPQAEHRHECGFDGIHDICRCVICGHDWRHGDLSYKLVDATFWPHPQSGIPMVKRASGRTIPDLTKREHVCEYQQSVKPRESGHVVLLEALKLMVKWGRKVEEEWGKEALRPDFVRDVAEAEAAIKQAERA